MNFWTLRHEYSYHTRLNIIAKRVLNDRGAKLKRLRGDGAPFIARQIDFITDGKSHHLVMVTVPAQYQLGFFGFGGHTGFAGTKPSRFGIWILGRLLASMTSPSWMMPFW